MHIFKIKTKITDLSLRQIGPGMGKLRPVIGVRKGGVSGVKTPLEE